VSAGDSWSALEAFIDLHMLGKIGPWSSRFPLQSKLTANYIAAAAPFLALVLILHWRKRGPRPTDQLLVMGRRQLVLLFSSMVLAIPLMVFFHYFSYYDLAEARSKYRVFGESRLMFAVFASMMMVALEFVLLAAFVLFIHYPLWRLTQRRPSI